MAYKFSFGQVLSDALTQIQNRNAQLKVHAEEQEFKQRQLDQAKELAETEAGVATSRYEAQRALGEKSLEAENRRAVAAEALVTQQNQMFGASTIDWDVAKPILEAGFAKIPGMNPTNPIYSNFMKGLSKVRGTDKVLSTSISTMLRSFQDLSEMTKYGMQADEWKEQTLENVQLQRMANAPYVTGGVGAETEGQEEVILSLYGFLPTTKKPEWKPKSSQVSFGPTVALSERGVGGIKISTSTGNIPRQTAKTILKSAEDILSTVQASSLRPSSSRTTILEQQASMLTILSSPDAYPDQFKRLTTSLGLNEDFTWDPADTRRVNRLILALSDELNKSKDQQKILTEEELISMRRENALKLFQDKETFKEENR